MHALSRFRTGGQAPNPVASPAQLTVRVGAEARFTCYATGDPPPVITWGFSFAGGPIRPGITHDDRELVIHNVQPADFGQYFCHASNAEGTAVAPVSLIEGELVEG